MTTFKKVFQHLTKPKKLKEIKYANLMHELNVNRKKEKIGVFITKSLESWDSKKWLYALKIVFKYLYKEDAEDLCNKWGSCILSRCLLWTHSECSSGLWWMPYVIYFCTALSLFPPDFSFWCITIFLCIWILYCFILIHNK